MSELDTSDVERTIPSAFFPSSAAPILRDGIFSEVLAKIQDAQPEQEDLDRIFEEIRNADNIDEESATRLWQVFKEGYVTSGRAGSWRRGKKEHLLVFSPEVAKRIKPPETRRWGAWYQMLMTSAGSFDEDLHDGLLKRLEELPSSNLFERLYIEKISEIDYQEEETSGEKPIRPYVEECATCFREDLNSWLEVASISPTKWLQGLRDIFCFHFMMYFIQLSINLREEFEALGKGKDDFTPEIQPIYFGLWDETASQNRRFSNEWESRAGSGVDTGVETDIYDSWGRLCATRIICDYTADEYGGSDSVFTPLEASSKFSRADRENCRRMLLEPTEIEEEDYGDYSFEEAVKELSDRVKRAYQQKTRSNQTPISAGIRTVMQLAEGEKRIFIRKQRRVGKTFRLDRAALDLFTRIFVEQEGDNHIESFKGYLSERGIEMDSKTEVALVSELEKMGLIDKRSDSGGSVYVRRL